MAAILRIETIGRCVAYVGERRIDPNAEIVFAALLFFGLERGRTHSRADVAQLFWPSAPQAVQRARLRWLLAKLRSLGLTVDAADLRLGFSSAMVKLDFIDLGDASATEIEAALPGYSPVFSEEFKAWTEAQRTKIGTVVVRQLLPRLSSAARVGEWDSTLGLAEAICRLDPLNEQAVLALAEAQCRLGSRTEGLRTLDRFLSEVGESQTELQLHAKLLEQRIRSIDSPSPRLESRFVGRESQLQAVDDLLRSTRDGAGGALMLTGPAGIGKTRLLDEAALRASMAGMQVVRVKCQRGDKGRPLGGIIELIPSLLELRGALGCDPAKLGRLRLLVQGHQSQGNVENVSLARTAWRRTEIMDAIIDLLDAAADEAPVLVQVDDVQWVERSLAWFWSPVVGWSTDHRVSWLFAMRTSSRWEPTLEIARVLVPALDSHDAEQLLDDLLAGTQDKAQIDRAALLARGAGSPLFLRELVRHCIGTGSTERLPMSLISLLDSGLFRLGKYSLRVLQVAAILGKHATLARIEAIARLPRPQFLDAVAELEIEAILTADASGMMTGHILWAEAAIARMTTNLCRLLHRHAAQQLEYELTESPRISIAWECARHWEEAGDIDHARARIVAAAETLAESGFPGDAASAYSRAINWAIDPHERLRLMDRRLALLSIAGVAHGVEADVDEYDRLAGEIDPTYDGHSEHELLKWRAHYLLTGDVNPQLDNGFRCASSTSVSKSHRLAAAKQCAIGAEYGSRTTLAAIYEIAISLEPSSLQERWDRYMVELTFNLQLGDADLARQLAEREVFLARSRGDVIRLAYSLGHVARACEITGDFASGMAALEERIKIGKRMGFFSEVRAGYDALIANLLEIGSIDEAKGALREFRVASEFTGTSVQTDFTKMIDWVYATQITLMEGRTEPLPPIEASPSTIANQPPRCRVRVLGVQLGSAVVRGCLGEATGYAEQLAVLFREPDGWRDWPATVYADFLAKNCDEEAASVFASVYIQSLRRETYPPPRALRQRAKPVGDLVSV